MASRKSPSSKPVSKPDKAELEKLKAKIEQLERENEMLLKQSSQKPKTHRTKNFFRKFGVTFFVTLCVVSFMLFNVANWVKASVVSTDGFLEVTTPLIEQPAVQQVLQQEITDALFENVDIEAELNNALPENLQFLAGPLTSQVQSYTYSKVGEVLASQKVEQVWDTSLKNIHAAVIDYINNENADGVITVNDVYTVASNNLSDSPVSFLLNKQLPDKVGDITIREVVWLDSARTYVNTIEKLPIVFLLTSIISFIIALALAIKKRTTIIVTLILLFVIMLSTVVSIVLGREIAANQVQPDFSAAVSEVFTVITNPLLARAQGYMALFGLIALVLIVSSRAHVITKARNFISSNTDKAIYKVTPTFEYPEWMFWLVENKTTIAWTTFTVLFVVLGLRIPPDYNQVINAFITSVVVTVVFYVVTLVLKTAKLKQK